ncbi:metallophosphoesterase [Chondromyces crocatus]|nr:metallophosphoesterase [Chondromyces crocatus]
MDALDQIHVVSDLHLGGIPGHQIFNQGHALAAVIDHLGREARHRRVGLVLNGDIVDFLAAEGATYLDPLGAVDKLEVIFDDDAFKPVWDALARFVLGPGAVLVLVLGNHDVELALPEVTERLVQRIAGSDEAARSRVRLGMDGSGYACEIGGRRVHCVHGNQVDPWNPVDFAALGKVVRAIEAGEMPPRWEPNAGTRLVVDVMNDIKLDYAFVDLLKPENVPVPAVLLGLPAKYRTSLFSFARIAVRRLYDQGRLSAGFLGGGIDEGMAMDPIDGQRALDILTRPEIWAAGTRSGSSTTAETPVRPVDWLRQACEDDAAGLRPTDVVLTGGDERLGISRILLDRARGRDARESLRDALARYLKDDQSFSFGAEDETFVALDKSVGEADFLVAGHTHLARMIPRRAASGFYFNSGTWIRLIQLTGSMLTQEGFTPIYDALRAGSLEALDVIPQLVMQRRTVVSIWAEGEEVVGELRAALPAPSPGHDPNEAPWRPEPGTRVRLPRTESTQVTP